MAGTADLASILVPQTTGVLRYGMGRIIAWDPQTFENVVEWSGIPIPNMLIANPTDALSYDSDMLVSLIGIDSAGEEGVTQWVIWGRLIQPGGGAAELAVDFLRGALAREISAEIFADRIYADSISTFADHASTTFGDPDTLGDPGPTVTGVNIASGTAIVFMSANMKFSSEDTASSDYASSGVISYQISGATSKAPDPNTAGLGSNVQKYRSDGPVDAVAGVNAAATLTKVVVETGLNPGLHTFQMKYQKWPPAATEPLHCDNRTLVVIAL
jgi:hypothetical protein